MERLALMMFHLIWLIMKFPIICNGLIFSSVTDTPVEKHLEKKGNLLFVPLIQYNRIPLLISTQLICQSIYVALSLAMLFLTDWFSLTRCTLVPIWAQSFQLLDISVMFEVVSSKFGEVQSFNMLHPKLSSINESAYEAFRQLVNCQAHCC